MELDKAIGTYLDGAGQRHDNGVVCRDRLDGSQVVFDRFASDSHTITMNHA